MPNQPPANLTVATTGASGSLFLKHFLLAAERDKRIQNVNFIASDSALRVMAEELNLKGRDKLVSRLLGKSSRKIHQQSNADIAANVASGSYPADAMVVIPCSVGTLARIANGIASRLIERAADVSLKEGRPLILCVRETPLNKIHIRNMYRAADAGATVFPLIPPSTAIPPLPMTWPTNLPIAFWRISVCRNQTLTAGRAISNQEEMVTCGETLSVGVRMLHHPDSGRTCTVGALSNQRSIGQRE